MNNTPKKSDNSKPEMLTQKIWAILDGHPVANAREALEAVMESLDYNSTVTVKASQ